MQILLFSDFHNAVDLRALGSVLSSLPSPDVVFTLGDISSTDLLALRELIPCVPIYGICGNHDGTATLDLSGIPNIHGKVVELCGLRFAGFGGSVRYKRGLYTMFSQKESLDIAQALPPADVLISHDRAFIGKYPDLSADLTQNPHKGLVGLSSYLQNKKPLLHFHGHIHENKRYLYNEIPTLCVHGAVLVELVEGSITNYRILCQP